MKTRRTIDFDRYRNLRYSGKSYSQIRVDLKSQGYLPTEITQVVNTLDTEELKEVINRANEKPLLDFLNVGCVLLLFGVAITYHSVTNDVTYLEAWGVSAMFSAFYMLFIGIKRRMSEPLK